MEKRITWYKCSRCIPVPVPELSDQEKAALIKYREENKTLRTIKFMMDEWNFSLIEAKNFFHHINYKLGKCHVCKVDDIEGENQNCRICGRFTVNWDIEYLKSLSS